MILIGADPGVEGAIAVLGGPVGDAVVYPMPVTKPAKGRARGVYDLARILRLLAASTGTGVATIVRPPVRVWIENLHAMPMKAGGSKANYGRGRAVAVLEMACVALGLPYELVPPQRWQRAICPGRGSTKGRSVAAARRLFPGVSLLPTVRARKAHDGLADALCIAEYGRRQLAGGELFAGKEAS